MLGNEDLTIPKKTVFGVLALLIALLLIDHYTGILTRLHLQNEESIVMEHGVNTPLYNKMLAELISDTTADEHWERRIAAVEIGHLGRGAARATDALEKLLDDEVPEVRAEAAIALARIGSHSGKAVSALIDVLSHGSDHEKYLAIKALGLIGADAKAAIPQLTDASINGHPDVRAAAIKALEIIGDPVQ